jgi:hypothetical protein
VAPGTKPAFTDKQVRATVEERLGEQAKGIKGRVRVEAAMALTKIALDALPPRADPDALIVPDHL